MWRLRRLWRLMIGIGYRKELSAWIETRPAGIDCLELTAEHFYEGGLDLIARLRSHFPLFIHSLGLSLGTAGPLDAARLKRFAGLVARAQPDWISEHVAFTRTTDVDLGHLNPLQPTRAVADVVAEHARQIQECCGRPLLLENITSHLRLRGELSEPDFLNRVCLQAGCGLLLDVTNLYINSRNHRFDPIAWLHQLDPTHIRQLHIVGYSFRDAAWHDGHAEAIQPDLLDLARVAAAYAPVRAVILERDANFPSTQALVGELDKLRSVFGSS